MKVVIRGDSMWPSYRDGEIIECQKYIGQNILKGDIVVFNHPLKSKVTCVKRVTSVENDSLFVEGDNPDPTASEDSHNFGPIALSKVLGIGGPGGT